MPPQEKAVAGLGPPEDTPGFGPPEDTPPVPDWRDKFTEIKPHDFLGGMARIAAMPTPGTAFKQGAKEAAREVGTSFSNIGAGGMGMVLHPLDTAKGAADMLGAAFDPSQAPAVVSPMIAQFMRQPLETAESIIGQAGVTEGLGGVLRAVPKVLKGGTEILTKTTPKETAGLVKETRAANAAETEKAGKANAAQAEKRASQVKQHFEKTKAADAVNEAVQNAKDRKVALERGVEHLDPELKTQLESTEKSVNAQANAKYQTFSKKLDPIEANPEFLPGALDEAMEKIKGSDTEPTILKDMAKKVQRGDTFSYRDLQGYRSELGKELSKGSLPGDVFHAYKGMQEAVTDEMQRIADSNGMGDQFKDARAFYRKYAEAFIDRNSPIRKALDSTERGGVVKSLRGKDQSGIETVAQFDPVLARRLNTVRGYADEAAKTRTSTAAPKTAPPLAPKPSPVEPNIKKLGPEDVRAAKQAGLEHRINRIRGRGEWIAVGAAGYRLLSHILRGQLGDVPGDLFEGGVAYGGVEAFSQFLENPKIQKLLTDPTPRDLAQIPPDLRAELGPVIEQAKKQGIKVNPALTLLVAGGAPKKQPPALAGNPLQ